MRKYHIFITISFALSVLFACKQPPKIYVLEIPLETMGTWGTVKIISDKQLDLAQTQLSIDSLLLAVNMQFSTYIDSSTISKFNQQVSGSVTVDSAFLTLFKSSITYVQNSKGAFNPKILPLIEYYGFGSKIGSLAIDSTFVDSLVPLINSDIAYDVTVDVDQYSLFKINPISLDYSAFAKGYGVDVVAGFLESKGVERYLVEIGGEVHCKGTNAKNEQWRLGIETPNTEERTIYQIVALNNQSMATSGNYRNFKELPSGQKLVHIINPATGYPETSNLLSATIFAPTCMEADAYATACMVMGLERSMVFVDTMTNLNGFFIYSDVNGELQHKMSANCNAFLVN